MKVKLQVAGSKYLLEKIQHELVSNPRAIKGFPIQDIQYELSYVPSDLCAENLLCPSEAPSVVLVDGANSALLQRIDGLHHQVNAQLLESSGITLRGAPIIAILDPGTVSRPLAHSQCQVSDWVFSDRIREELAFRVAALLRRNSEREFVLQAGAVRLFPETRTIVLGEATTRLPPSEYALAEFFFKKLGTIISLRDLTEFFESTGKSAAMNNIRVTIYQLRMKLEDLSRSQLTITTVYRKGYCLKQVPASSRVRTGPRPIAEPA